MVPRGLEHQVKFPEVLERLVAPHSRLCEDSSVVCRPECHEEGCRHVRAEFSHFSNRALVPGRPPASTPHHQRDVLEARDPNFHAGNKPLVKDKKPKKKPKPQPQKQQSKEASKENNNGAKDAAAASKTKKGKKGAK